MKYIATMTFVFSLFIANPIFAGQDEYDDCLLKHLINAKVDSSTQIMKNACRELFKDYTIVLEKRKEYNECLLKYLPGVESDDAVTEIQEVCNRKYL